MIFFLALFILSSYAGIFGVILLVGWVNQQASEKSRFRGAITPNMITVIIPFRNEEKRIEGLLKSISLSKVLPAHFLFLNDHSSDKSGEVITQRLVGFPITIIDLPNEIKGKKQAIKYGVSLVNTAFVLTLDADVTFSETYFNAFTNLGPADLYILPVIMKATSRQQHCFEFDTLLLHALNAGISGLARPIVASGANLLFSKSCFDECSRYVQHGHIASGDDMFLLKDFRAAKNRILLSTDNALRVETETPQSWREFFHQRIRWIAKSKDVNDHFANAIALVQIIFSVSFLFLFIFLLLSSNLNLLILSIFTKCFLDTLFYAPYFLRTGHPFHLFFLHVYQLLLPVYQFLILLATTFVTPIWKGRPVGIKKG